MPYQGSVTSTHTKVVVLGGGSFELKFDDGLEYYVAEIALEGRQLGATGTITAKLGSASATCNLVVARDDGGPSLHIEVRDRKIGNRRALVEKTDEVTSINIMGLHPSIKRYLGPAPDFPNQDKPLCRALIAEIVAGECARMMIEKKHQSVDQHVDAAAMYVEHYKYLTRYLNRCHRVLITDAALP